LLGYTDEEIDHYFTNQGKEVAQHLGISQVELRKEIRYWYNGYRFSEQPCKVYNLFSILYFLEKRKLSNYWFDSGTSFFLVELLKKQYSVLEHLEQLELSASSLGTFELDGIPLIPLLFQTGYLTIQDYDAHMEKFTLAFPNHEVEESLKKYLVTVLSYSNAMEVDTILSKLVRAITANDLETFCSLVETLFAHIPYTLHVNKENYYHALLQFLLSLVSLDAQSENVTDVGRIDLVLTTKTHLYIFELKVGANPEVALEQILDRKYYQKFVGTNKHITLAGLSFYPEKQKTHLSYVAKRLN
jgi:hypothetical protein